MCWFFFSSRRRHTRSLCDWSSDVCSSDLWAYHSAGPRPVLPPKETPKEKADGKTVFLARDDLCGNVLCCAFMLPGTGRSASAAAKGVGADFQHGEAETS